MSALGVGPDRFKVAGAWAGEKAGRLKLNGHLTGYSPQSRVIEFEGLVVGRHRQALPVGGAAHVAPQEPRLDVEELDRLILRAERQIADLEEQRLKAVAEAVAAAVRA